MSPHAHDLLERLVEHVAHEVGVVRQMRRDDVQHEHMRMHQSAHELQLERTHVHADVRVPWYPSASFGWPPVSRFTTFHTSERGGFRVGEFSR